MSVDVHARMFCRRVGHWRGDSGETLAVSVDVERAQLGCGEFDGRPFESDGGLCDIAHLEP